MYEGGGGGGGRRAHARNAPCFSIHVHVVDRTQIPLSKILYPSYGILSSRVPSIRVLYEYVKEKGE